MFNECSIECFLDFHLPYLSHQGLNLDDCSATYDQIERSQAHGPYQDVCNIIEEEEEIQLEKPWRTEERKGKRKGERESAECAEV